MALPLCHCARALNSQKLCKSLGVKVLPYLEIVAGKFGKVETFTCGPSKVSRLQEKLELHATCLIEDIPCTSVGVELDDVDV